MRNSGTTAIVIWLLLAFSVYGQQPGKFQYINPKSHSGYASPESSIIIREGSTIDRTTVDEKLIKVYGSQSGIHKGNFLLSDDSRTLVFNPYLPFLPWEKVTVELNEGIKTGEGKNIGKLNFDFFINRKTEPGDIKKLNKFDDDLPVESPANQSLTLTTQSIPSLIVDSVNNPSPGYMFIAPTPYLMIVDDDATPVFYRNTNGSVYDFKLQPTGEITYFIYDPLACYALDSSLNVKRTFQTANGYSIDVHDLRVYPNGHYFILGKKLIDVDMSKVVAGGDSTAQIIDMALQEFDSTGNLVFQWSALDNYQITDADDHVSLTQNQIDFVHFNSIEVDTDGNIILSARNLDEITKINHNTGEIIWRMGGENNQFTFINDDRGFSRQHDVRRISNGDITVFDNGVFHPDPYSSMVEYKLDEVNKTATLINRYSHNKLYTMTRGDIEELPNGNKFISWGEVTNPAVTEIKPDNSIAYELSFGAYYLRFHSYRFPWETNLFRTDVDTVDFGKIESNDSVKKEIKLYNDKDSSVIINQFFYKDSSFSVLNNLPLIIPGKDSLTITVKFNPKKNGAYSDKLNIRWIGNDELIARQVVLNGSTINLIQPINAPTNLHAISANNEINLTWKDNSDNEAGFIIERKQGDSSGSNNFIKIDTTAANDTLYIDNSLHDSLDYTYRVFAFNNDTVSTFSNYATTINISSVEQNNVIKDYFLFQNYPNPFNPSTNISYQIPKSGYVSLILYNTLGQKVKTLVNEFQNNGSYSLKFDATDLPSGIYFYRLKVNRFSSVKKLVLLH
jgi:Arylsulfotransferase (ASST)/Secretion system C-terminal sorting domain/Cep192 domain 4